MNVPVEATKGFRPLRPVVCDLFPERTDFVADPKQHYAAQSTGGLLAVLATKAATVDPHFLIEQVDAAHVHLQLFVHEATRQFAVQKRELSAGNEVSRKVVAVFTFELQLPVLFDGSAQLTQS